MEKKRGIYFFSEKENINSDAVHQDLINRGYCSYKDNQIKFNASGFIIHKNNAYIIFPTGMQLKSSFEENKRNMALLLNVFYKYIDMSKDLRELQEIFEDTEGDELQFFSTAMWLLRDYLQYGYYRKKIKTIQNNTSHRVHWNRTINTKNPIFQEGQPIYYDLVTVRELHDLENIIYQIHQYVIGYSHYLFGWLLNISLEHEFNEENFPCNINQAIQVLYSELHKTNQDREIKLLKAIIRFLEGIEESNKIDRLFTMVTKSFHSIWEKICSEIFENQYNDLQYLLPCPVWANVNSIVPFNRQIADIMFVEDEILYILDAKYYNTKNNVPGWHDMVKQFYYYLSISENIRLNYQNIKFNKIRNIFIFPGECKDQEIKYFGRVDIVNCKTLGEIMAFNIDTQTAFQVYLNYYTSEYRNNLINYFKHPNN